jgi:nitroreductase
MPASDPLDTLRPLVRTRQYREFTPEPPTEAELTALTEVARWTGSSRNTQPWRFIVIHDRDVIARIHDAGVPQTRALLTAPVAIAIVLSGDPGDVEHAFDEGRVSERLLIGARLLGLGAGVAWAKEEVRPLIGELLGLPADHFVRTIVVVGHPTEAATHPKSAPGKARRPASEMVFAERWPQD